MTKPALKDRLRKIGTGALVGALAPLFMIGATAEAKELRFVHAYPVASQHHRNVEWYTQQVTERTNGEITFKVFPSAQIMPINQELPGILAGQVSMTYSVAPIVAAVEPLWGVFDLPFLFNVSSDSTEHGRRFFQSDNGGKMLANAMEKRGFKLVSMAPTDLPSGPALTSAEGVDSLDDLQGLKLRIPGGKINQLAGETLGFSPIAISGAEMVPALTQGVVDGAILPPIYSYDNKLPIKSLTLAPVSWPAVTPIIMSLAEFTSLSDDQQKVIMEVGVELEARALQILEESSKEKIQSLQSELGVNVIELSDEETAKWLEQAQSVWTAFIDDNGEDARIMVEEAKRLRN